jgi:hypothetical protein
MPQLADARFDWVKGNVRSFQGNVMAESDKVFAGFVPKFYDALVVS